MPPTYTSTFILILALSLTSACLITNCPRGGKRSKLILPENLIRPCVRCGPGKAGQCFGPNICCGPFGCLLGTTETMKCQKEGMFHEQEPCMAGATACRKNTGRCAFDGICCNQDACYMDKTCSVEEKFKNYPESPVDLYNLISYTNELGSE